MQFHYRPTSEQDGAALFTFKGNHGAPEPPMDEFQLT